MTTHRLLKIGMVLGLCWVLSWLFLANPFNLCVPQSEHFTMKKFKTFGPGNSIAQAISSLGDPVAVVRQEQWEVGCAGCVRYCFMGNPPSWIIGFQEAWLVADQNGAIVRSFVNTEP